jgi:hypothetical protein
VIERYGRVDVIREDLAVSGSYHVVIDETAQPPTARGTARMLDRPHLVHRALGVERVLLCFDGHAEVEVEVTVYVPGASFFAFLCRDATAVLKLPQ